MFRSQRNANNLSVCAVNQRRRLTDFRRRFPVIYMRPIPAIYPNNTEGQSEMKPTSWAVVIFHPDTQIMHFPVAASPKFRSGSEQCFILANESSFPPLPDTHIRGCMSREESARSSAHTLYVHNYCTSTMHYTQLLHKHTHTYMHSTQISHRHTHCSLCDVFHVQVQLGSAGLRKAGGLSDGRKISFLNSFRKRSDANRGIFLRLKAI